MSKFWSEVWGDVWGSLLVSVFAVGCLILLVGMVELIGQIKFTVKTPILVFIALGVWVIILIPCVIGRIRDERLDRAYKRALDLEHKRALDGH